MAKEKPQRKPKKQRNAGLMISLLYGTAFAFLVMLALLLTLPLVLRTNPDPDRMIPAFALIIAMISGITGGIASAKKHGASGALTGLLSGMLFTTILFVLSLFFKAPQGASSVGYKLLLVCMIIFPGAIGGKSCFPKKGRRRR